jgi:hypothetical protein
MKPRDPRWAGRWLAVFVANLALPLFFGFDMARNAGMIGLSAAVVLAWAWIYLVGSRSPFIAKSMLIGGSVVAVAQILMLLHVGAGSVGMAVARSAGQASGIRVTSELGGFIATAVTGCILQGAALFVGGLTAFAVSLPEGSMARKPSATTADGVYGRERDA